MTKFRDAYREAVERLPGGQADAAGMELTSAHRRFAGQNRKRIVRAGAAAAAVLFCCLGSVAAYQYETGRIRMNGDGFTVDGVSDATTAGADGGAPEAYNEMGGVLESADEVPSSDKLSKEQISETREYSSVQEFREAETMTAAIPDAETFGVAFTQESVSVTERLLNVSYLGDEGCFLMCQQDNREYPDYSAATSYTGESAHERYFTNSQGLCYLVFDTVENGQIESTHAVISVNGRDLTLNFMGFSQDIIEDVLRTLDLSVYFMDEGGA